MHWHSTPLSVIALFKSSPIFIALSAAGANVEYAFEMMPASDLAAQEEVAGFIAESGAETDVSASEQHGPIILGNLWDGIAKLTVCPSICKMLQKQRGEVSSPICTVPCRRQFEYAYFVVICNVLVILAMLVQVVVGQAPLAPRWREPAYG